MLVKEIIARAVQRVIDRVMGNNLMQDDVGVPLGERYVTPGMPALIRQSGAEGCVLLKNNGILPLTAEKTVSVFGRCQNDTFYVGYGSGGDVHPPYQVSIMEGLKTSGGPRVNETLAKLYRDWSGDEKNVPSQGQWGHWPMNYPEMPLTEQAVSEAARQSDAAVVVIGRAAGEDRENLLEQGSYYLTDEETRLLDLVTAAFDRVVILMNCGNIIDMAWTEKYQDKIAALMLIWQCGMETGNAVADVLSGKVNPCGKLSDTIAKTYQDYPSAAHFGGTEFNEYREDIFVGYRYFETFARDKVRYPFGFGLSYTTFEVAPEEFLKQGDQIRVTLRVSNRGNCAGKEVVQLYCSAPQGKLGKSRRSLAAFQKTETLPPGESVRLTLSCNPYDIASFDDTGKSGYPFAYVLEAGEYQFFAGDVPAGSFTQRETLLVRQLEEICVVQDPFARMTAADPGTASPPDLVISA